MLTHRDAIDVEAPTDISSDALADAVAMQEQGMRDADLPRQDRAQSVRAFRCRATTMAIPGSTVLTNSRERR